jgi:hypothetical protein
MPSIGRLLYERGPTNLEVRFCVDDRSLPADAAGHPGGRRGHSPLAVAQLRRQIGDRDVHLYCRTSAFSMFWRTYSSGVSLRNFPVR